ncbi:very short patch repair endonuclease [Mycobacterium sherrisii]|uniref:very short patch repair endonuclease n=1 Tax=Mycobacterium sherrisii TaxID=243061 RepID=UPI000A0310E7|nr:very short patch repair endonuclease [Mycobacterium sherrisii]
MVESWASSAGVRASMQANKGRDTKPEVALRSAVHALGLRYRVSTRPLKGLRRTADMVFPRARVAVFLDGCFWHGCPDHHTVAVTNRKFWADKVVQNRARDRDTDQRLEEAGWLSVRVWEHEDPCEAALRIWNVVSARKREGTGRRAKEGPEAKKSLHGMSTVT